jgi:hypothetical protein
MEWATAIRYMKLFNGYRVRWGGSCVAAIVERLPIAICRSPIVGSVRHMGSSAWIGIVEQVNVTAMTKALIVIDVCHETGMEFVTALSSALSAIGKTGLTGTA